MRCGSVVVVDEAVYHHHHRRAVLLGPCWLRTSGLPAATLGASRCSRASRPRRPIQRVPVCVRGVTLWSLYAKHGRDPPTEARPGFLDLTCPFQDGSLPPSVHQGESDPLAGHPGLGRGRGVGNGTIWHGPPVFQPAPPPIFRGPYC